MAMIMPKPKAPCGDCTERTVGCHGTCEKYAEFQSEWRKIRREFKKKVYDEKMTQDYVIDSVYRMQDKRKMMK